MLRLLSRRVPVACRAAVAWQPPKPSDRPWASLGALGALGSALVVATKVHELRCELPQMTQGKFAESLMQTHLRNKGLAVRTQVRMHSNVRTGAKTDIRIIDIVDSEGGYHEVKSGCVNWSQKTLNQIEKDSGILANDPYCKDYTWEFFPGKDGKMEVDERILQKLKDNNIKYNLHHDIASEKAKDALSHTNKKVMEGTKEGNKLHGDAKLKAAAKQAQILKAVGAVNLAVSLLSLGAACYLHRDVKSLQSALPEVREECERFLASVARVQKLLDEAIAQPKSHLESRQCEIKKEFDNLKRTFEDVKKKCNDILDRAQSDRDKSEATAIVSSCTAVIGLVVTIASCGCDCGAGVAMGLTSVGTGVAGALISVENIGRCNQTMAEVNNRIDQVTSRHESLEEKYQKLLGVLGQALQNHLAGDVWWVHGWAHKTNRPALITMIARPDSLSLLEHVGNGSVLEAKGKNVNIGTYSRKDRNGSISVCQILNIWRNRDYYEAGVQCSHQLHV